MTSCRLESEGERQLWVSSDPEPSCDLIVVVGQRRVELRMKLAELERLGRSVIRRKGELTWRRHRPRLAAQVALTAEYVERLS